MNKKKQELKVDIYVSQTSDICQWHSWQNESSRFLNNRNRQTDKNWKNLVISGDFNITIRHSFYSLVEISRIVKWRLNSKHLVCAPSFKLKSYYNVRTQHIHIPTKHYLNAAVLADFNDIQLRKVLRPWTIKMLSTLAV